MIFHVSKKNLIFRFAARTSRNVMLERPIWIVRAEDHGAVGLGECAPIFGLSHEKEDEVVHYLELLSKHQLDWENDLHFRSRCPSVLMAIETAMADWQNSGLGHPFYKAKKLDAIPINGLVWMDELEAMYHQALEKIQSGFTTIKLKVGAHDFQDELRLIATLRKDFPAESITIRLDANGAWSPTDAYDHMRELAPYHIHSIEQPLMPQHRDALRYLAQENIIPIALDESLIGPFDLNEKRELLEWIRPQYIILKPTLHGGFHGTNEWIEAAEEFGIQWWITSALESSIGLNAIARWLLTKNNSMPQGLGTGSLYTNNFISPWITEGGHLIYQQDADQPIFWDV